MSPIPSNSAVEFAPTFRAAVPRELVKANFIKEVDSLTGEYIYRNRRTGQLSRRKPVFLGSDDLETPRCRREDDRDTYCR